MNQPKRSMRESWLLTLLGPLGTIRKGNKKQRKLKQTEGVAAIRGPMVVLRNRSKKKKSAQQPLLSYIERDLHKRTHKYCLGCDKVHDPKASCHPLRDAREANYDELNVEERPVFYGTKLETGFKLLNRK